MKNCGNSHKIACTSKFQTAKMAHAFSILGQIKSIAHASLP